MSDDIERWQQALAAEHAAIWAYGLVGATPPLAAPASAALDTHRGRRARCVDAVVSLGGDPVTSAVAYEVEHPRSADEGRRVAADLEQRCSVAYAALSGADERRTRLQAAQWLRESAVATWAWDGEVPVLPGLE
jgi:hypothetical protein